MNAITVVLTDAVTAPRRALMSSAQGSFVWVVGDGDVVELRPVSVTANLGDLAVIGEGLTGGERVVVEGVLKVQPGAKVSVAAPGATAAPSAEGGAGR
jgi:hypothetical protein